MINSYIALDLETTGLNPRSDKIIEIGALKIIDGKIIDTYSTLVDAGIPISERITKLTGISNRDITGEIKTEKAINELLEFCGDSILLGHNIIFDYSFIKQAAINQKLKFEKTGIDTLKIAKKVLPNLEKRSLEYLCDYYQIDHENKHRAYDDAKAASDLYIRLFRDFGENNLDSFKPFGLFYHVKKQMPITGKQKSYLNDLLKYHRIKLDLEINALTKSEASRIIDKIILNHGRPIRSW